MSSADEMLGQFAANRSLSLGFHDKVYGDDDDLPTHGNWVVWEEIGNINDREWLVRGFGPTPLAALSSAFGETYVDEYGSTVIHDGRPIDDGDDEPPTGGRKHE